MAWRIDEQVTHGEIDNRERGRVSGRLWFVGRDTPVVLDLVGDAWRDLAGRRLVFRNPEPKPGDLAGLDANQRGAVGDITASRKVKVPDVSMEEVKRCYAARQPFPWHWGNSLYLEWYGETNGRIVIESASYELMIDPEGGTWDMTEAEEAEQRAANGTALSRFMTQLTEDLETSDEPEPILDASSRDGPDEEIDRPLTEAEAEELQAESDRLTDRVNARLEREGPNADLGRIIEEEIERARRERGDPELTPEEEAERQQWLDGLNAAAEEVDDDDDGDGQELRHPLVRRSRELILRVMEAVETNQWAPEEGGPEHPVTELEADLMKAGAKLAGGLDRREWPPPLRECATTIVWLKRAVRFFDDAALAAEVCRRDGLADPAWLDGVTAEMQGLSRETSALIEELRIRLQRGFD